MTQYAFQIMTAAAFIFFITTLISMASNRQLRRKNEAKRQMIEAAGKPAPPPKKPSRISLRTKGTQQIIHEIVYGHRFKFERNGALVIQDDEGLIAAAFGPGKWISAIVVNEPKAPAPTDESKPKENTCKQNQQQESPTK